MRESYSPRGTILVADDNDVVRDTVEHMLRVNGYRVLAAVNGEEALELLQTLPIDLALFAGMMPGLTGFALCRAAKARPETRLIPIVLITEMGRSADHVRGALAGADDFLNKPVRQEELLARVKSLVRSKRCADELESAETVLCTLAASIEARDPYTEGHCERVSRCSAALAARLGLPEEDRVALRRSGAVHDIGKIGVPERLLLKPGPLHAEELQIMEAHTMIGERICAPLKSFHNVLPIIRWHHERQDGTGYPDHLRGAEIPLLARVLQTVDIYDALSMKRPYRAALPHEKALATMREEVTRGWWDGALVNELESLLGASPELIALAEAPCANGAQPGPRKAEQEQMQEELAWASYVQVA